MLFIALFINPTENPNDCELFHLCNVKWDPL